MLALMAFHLSAFFRCLWYFLLLIDLSRLALQSGHRCGNRAQQQQEQRRRRQGQRQVKN